MNLLKLAGLIVITIGLISCGVSPSQNKTELNQLTKAEIKQGWELLFDGKSFNGWRGLGRESVQADHWRIENGNIRKMNSHEVPLQADGKPIDGGDLMTIETFDNFELTFEWKIKEGGNSGIKYNVSEELSQKFGSKYGALGFEYQILDDASPLYVGKLRPSQFSGALYEMYTPVNVHLNPPGQFNSGRIVLNGNHGEHWLNGVKVVEYEFGSEKFDSLFQLSKYHKYTDFEKKRKGHIVITNHTDDSWYRNIRIRKL